MATSIFATTPNLSSERWFCTFAAVAPVDLTLALDDQVDSAGSMTTVAGSGQYGYVNSDAATAASMRYPTGITGSADGSNLFISDNQNDVIRKVLVLCLNRFSCP